MQEAEVVLINANLHAANNPAPAPGLGYLAAVLEANGVAVKVIDAAAERLDLAAVVEKCAAIGPRVIGLTCLTSYRFDTFEMAAALKARDRTWKIVVGGPHVTFLDEATLRRVPAIDCVVRGEGEFGFLEYLACDFPGEVKGLTFREGKGVFRTPDRAPLRNLDTLPFPAYHLFCDFSAYDEQYDVPPRMQGVRHAPVVSSRGCPHGCIFCSSADFWRGRPAFRARSAGNIVDEIEHLYHNFDVRYIRFFDDNFTADGVRVHAVCDEIMRRGLRVWWRAEARLDGVDERLLEKMAAAGCHEIEYGVETASPQVARGIKKNVAVERLSEVAAMTRRAGMAAKAFFIVGLPGETREDFLCSLRASGNFDYVAAFPLLVFPGSPLCRQLEREGQISEASWFEQREANPFKGFERVPLDERAFDATTMQKYIELMNDYNFLRRRLGAGLRLRNLPHPRRMLYISRSIVQEYRKLAGLAAAAKVRLPLPLPARMGGA